MHEYDVLMIKRECIPSERTLNALFPLNTNTDSRSTEKLDDVFFVRFNRCQMFSVDL